MPNEPNDGLAAAGPAGGAGAAAQETVADAHAAGTGLTPEEEPVTTGTLFILLIFLMAMGAMWAIMYFTLVQR